MTYYLLSGKDQYQICFVKDEDNARFRMQWRQQIVEQNCDIRTLLYLMDKDLVTAFSFGNN